MQRLAFVLGFLVLLAGARADLVHLKDGTTLEGVVKKSADGGWVITASDGKVTRVASDAVKSISFIGRENTALTGADDKLASLRRAVENVTDAKQVVQRYQNFIEQNKTSDAADAAKQDLAVWQDRLDRGLIKVGSQWITPGERDAMKEKVLLGADNLRKLIQAGRLAEADQELSRLLEIDSNNASLQFLRGLLLYRQNQIIPTRKAFEAANQQVPNHAPTLNNLAVIAIRQNQWLAALGYFDQAMVANPQNRAVLDNVAEALYALPYDARKTPIAQKAAQHFSDQDTKLAARLEKDGLYRWGSTWVDGKKLEEVKAAEKEMKAKMDALQADFDSVNQRITKIDDDIASNTRIMRNWEAIGYLEGQNYSRRNGTGVNVGLPNSYYDLQADNRKLQEERNEQVAKLEQIRLDARNLQRQYPIPKYTGNFRLIDVEGTPVDLPTTQPSGGGAVTQPATRAAWKV